MEYTNFFADRVKDMKGSAIREMFKRMADPEIISLAGGNPASELFPGEELSKIAGKILMTNPTLALQYGTTDGYPKMKECAKQRAEKVNSYHEDDEILIMTGANQGIDLTAKSLLNKGDAVIVENPSFIGSLNSFRSYNAKLFGVEMDSDGINIEKTEEILKTQNIKLIYTIPTFQNPMGITQSLEKRKKLLELAEKYDCYIIEDNPYGELRFSGEAVRAIKSMDENGRVIYVGSFSKTLSPGIRVGFVCCHKDIMNRIVVVKQVNDVHTPLMNQMLVTEYIKNYDYDEHIKKGCRLYGEKCALMLESIEKYFPKCVTHTNPDGGIFLWCTMPQNADSKKIFEKAIDAKVAFVPGNTCMVDIDAPSNCFRLNYSTASNENIVKGIEILGGILKNELE